MSVIGKITGGPADSSLPRHVAIIMDGNGRWAKKRFMPRPMGHREGVKIVRRTVTACLAKGIEALTLFAFSSENWQRPRKEVELLMALFSSTLQREIDNLDKDNVRLRFIGDRAAFGHKLRSLMDSGEEQTRNNTGLVLTIAGNYGGRWDITRAARSLAERVARGEIQPEDISEETLEAELSLPGIPDPDLFIRTGGEQRVSNFLLWQLAYTEMYFTDTLWPDFDEASFDAALASYATRQRRFGRTGEQVERLKGA